LKRLRIRAFGFIGAVVLLGALSACASSQPPQIAASAPTAVQPTAASGSGLNATAIPATPNTTAVVLPTREPIAALVNENPISYAAFQRELNRRLDGIKSLGDPMPADMNAFRLTVLDSMIDQVLIEQAAQVQKVVVTDAEVEAELQDNINIAGGKDKLQTQLDADHMTLDDYRARLHSALIANKMRDIVTANVGMTADQVHARHILVSSEATANDVLAKLKAGQDFATLASQYSQDTSTRDTGGDLGWFAKGELLEPTVEDAAFALNVNQVSAPVKSKLGYHIIQTLERVKDRPISPETHAKLSAHVVDVWLQSLIKSAKIEKYPDGHTQA